MNLTTSEPVLKMWGIIRGDLNMSPGKASSQLGHAFVGAFLHASGPIQQAYHSEFPASPGTKVCLEAKNLYQLELAEHMAREMGIPCYKVTDSGCENFFDGKPTVTALGLGPATKEQIHKITKRFQLVK